MPKFRPLPPLERLNELFEVVEIPEDKFGKWSGLVWKVNRRGKARAGSVAGYPQPDATNPDRNDWRVSIDGVDYYASRVIYFMTHGENPGDVQVDHEDQDWLNNNAKNLRLAADGSFQKINSPTRRDNTSGVVGVSREKGSKKWRVDVKGKYLGRFICKIEAVHVVRDKWIELGWDKLGRKLPDLSKLSCDCGTCKLIDLG